MVPRSAGRVAGDTGAGAGTGWRTAALLLLMSFTALPANSWGTTTLKPPLFDDYKSPLGELKSNFCQTFATEGGSYQYGENIVPPLEMVRYDANSYTSSSNPSVTVLPIIEKYAIPPYKSGEKLVIFVPDFNADSTSESSVALVKALISANKRHGIRIYVVEHRFHSTYASAIWAMARMGTEIEDFVEHLVTQKGYRPGVIHMIGHGLGVQVIYWLVGITRKYYSDNNGIFDVETLESMILLDPAMTCFPEVHYGGFSPKEKFELMRFCKFVQVYHSNPGVIGMGEPMGHLDVYMASPAECRALTGRHKMTCDHAHSMKTFVRSIVEPRGTFKAKKCSTENKGFDLKSLWNGKNGAAKCSGRDEEVGYFTSNTTQGIYFYTPR